MKAHVSHGCTSMEHSGSVDSALQYVLKDYYLETQLKLEQDT